ncbi:hypothetical protein EJB05_50257, partial [Eragrostis curvula]
GLHRRATTPRSVLFVLRCEAWTADEGDQAGDSREKGGTPEAAATRAWAIDQQHHGLAEREICYALLQSVVQSPDDTPVYLNVYNFTPMNGYTYWAGLGIFHSRIE